MSAPKKKQSTIANAKTRVSKLSVLWDFWAPIFCTLVLYGGIRHFLAEARYIPSGSMLPGLQINDRLLIEKLTYRSRSPRRGEIVVFNSPYSFDPVLIAERTKPLPSDFKCGLVSFPIVNVLPWVADPACNAYIKRVVAIEGDFIDVKSTGGLIVNGKPVSESYVGKFCSGTQSGFSHCKAIKGIVPKDYVLVLGDNRSNSWDGRYWPGGAFLAEKEIIGRAFWRFWPLERIGALSL